MGQPACRPAGLPPFLCALLPRDGDDHDAHGVLAHIVDDPAVEEDVEDERVDDDDEVEEGEGETTRRSRIRSPICDAPKGRRMKNAQPSTSAKA